MSSYLEMRVARLELDNQALKNQLAAMARALDQVAQAQRVGQLGGYNGGGGSPGKAYWCVGDGTARAATGTWPSLTPATFTSDVYEFVGGVQTLVGSGKTINWPYKDAMSTTAGKLIPCVLNGDQTTYDADMESCLKVT